MTDRSAGTSSSSSSSANSGRPMGDKVRDRFPNLAAIRAQPSSPRYDAPTSSMNLTPTNEEPPPKRQHISSPIHDISQASTPSSSESTLRGDESGILEPADLFPTDEGPTPSFPYQDAMKLFADRWQMSAEAAVNRLMRVKQGRFYRSFAYDAITHLLQPLVSQVGSLKEQKKQDDQLRELTNEMNKLEVDHLIPQSSTAIRRAIRSQPLSIDSIFQQHLQPVEMARSFFSPEQRIEWNHNKIVQYFHELRCHLAYNYIREEVIQFIAKTLAPKLMEYERKFGQFDDGSDVDEAQKNKNQEDWECAFNNLLNENHFYAKVLYLSSRIIHHIINEPLYDEVFRKYQDRALGYSARCIREDELARLSQSEFTRLIFRATHRMAHHYLLKQKLQTADIKLIYSSAFKEIKLEATLTPSQMKELELHQMDDGLYIDTPPNAAGSSSSSSSSSSNGSTSQDSPVRPWWNYEMRRTNFQIVIFDWLLRTYKECRSLIVLAHVALLQSIKVMEETIDNGGFNPNFELHETCMEIVKKHYEDTFEPNIRSSEAERRALIYLLNCHRQFIHPQLRRHLTDEGMKELVKEEVRLFFSLSKSVESSQAIFECIIATVARAKQRFYRWAYNIQMTANAYDPNVVYPMEYLQDVNPWPFSERTQQRFDQRRTDSTPVSVYKHGRFKTSDRRTPLEYRLPVGLKTARPKVKPPKSGRTARSLTSLKLEED